MIRLATTADLPALGRIFLSARHTAMPWLSSPHTDEEVLAWFEIGYPVKYKTFVAEVEGEIAGFAGWSPGWLDHLYLAPPFWRQGIGGTLFEAVAKAQPEGFQFWVFQRNLAARAFYERLGGRLVEETDGGGNMEKEPDCRYEFAGILEEPLRATEDR